MSTFNKVSQWNLVCGKTAPEFGTSGYYTTLRNQAARIQEELEELQEAIDNCEVLLSTPEDAPCTLAYKGDPIERFATEEVTNHWNQEILDAGCDLDVVVAGLNFLSGHDYDGAIEVVLGNNDLKYTYNRTDAEKALLKAGPSTHSIIEVPVEVEDEDVSARDLELSGYDVWFDGKVTHVIAYSVHRDSDDKICKLLNHPTVDLSPFVTK